MGSNLCLHFFLYTALLLLNIFEHFSIWTLRLHLTSEESLQIIEMNTQHKRLLHHFSCYNAIKYWRDNLNAINGVSKMHLHWYVFISVMLPNLLLRFQSGNRTRPWDSHCLHHVCLTGEIFKKAPKSLSLYVSERWNHKLYTVQLSLSHTEQQSSASWAKPSSSLLCTETTVLVYIAHRS